MLRGRSPEAGRHASWKVPLLGGVHTEPAEGRVRARGLTTDYALTFQVLSFRGGTWSSLSFVDTLSRLFCGDLPFVLCRGEIPQA